jgi:hypothetical protein
MNYQNYLDSPQGNHRQAPPSPSQAGAMTMMNAGNGMAAMPTPAGHQQDLNYVMGLVDTLSAELAANREQTRRIVEATGRIRNRAMELGMTNEEILGEVAGELNGMSVLIECEITY